MTQLKSVLFIWTVVALVKTSNKPVLQQLYNIAKQDVIITTGSNLRNILLLTDCLSIDNLDKRVIGDIEYNKIMEQDKWRINLVKEVLDFKHGQLAPPDGWSIEELEEILNFACTQ